MNNISKNIPYIILFSIVLIFLTNNAFAFNPNRCSEFNQKVNTAGINYEKLEDIFPGLSPDVNNGNDYSYVMFHKTIAAIHSKYPSATTRDILGSFIASKYLFLTSLCAEKESNKGLQAYVDISRYLFDEYIKDGNGRIVLFYKHQMFDSVIIRDKNNQKIAMDATHTMLAMYAYRKYPNDLGLFVGWLVTELADWSESVRAAMAYGSSQCITYKTTKERVNCLLRVFANEVKKGAGYGQDDAIGNLCGLRYPKYVPDTFSLQSQFRVIFKECSAYISTNAVEQHRQYVLDMLKKLSSLRIE